MTDQSKAQPAGNAREVFRAFLRLGLTSFGGPIAHLGYFRNDLVVKRRWINEADFADLVALCQFLPGPASSQVGFALGVLRGGPLGGLAAWTAFTLPSALLLVAFAAGLSLFADPAGQSVLHGLQLAAVAVVAQAVWGMARSLAPDRPRAGIALCAILLAAFTGAAFGQVAAIGLGALAGLVLCRGEASSGAGRLHFPVSRRAGAICIGLFFLLLLLSMFEPSAVGAQGAKLFAAVYRSGALVFGGGHVVLPLLQASVVRPGWVTGDAFLAGYGAAQAVPGPLFSFSAYLGAVAVPAPNGLAGAAIALVGIFLPGLLLVAGMLPFWDSLRGRPMAQAAMRGANAAVVGILAAALYDPVWTSAVRTPKDFAVAAIGFLLLTLWKAPPWLVVLLAAAGGWLLITP
ncbi:chromate efflux transporter [Solirhodobacter olei]|uniref:chromate efflux transporter n=1 Tax=Solirhodobacter olei TaxID=2493082 RepID=UPI000FD7B7FB|nr:chromate efflux transporter [Solirhodobacter olei]